MSNRNLQDYPLEVDDIDVKIPDTVTPIVILFGPDGSGKTSVFLRMIRYLEEHGYHVEPERFFRPSYDMHYTRMCDELREQVYNIGYVPSPNDAIDFMLVKVLKDGYPVCQILDAPGWHYFNGRADIGFPTYINRIFATDNRKILAFFVEQDWGVSQDARTLYAKKICRMQRMISPKDKVIFLFNKADQWEASQYNNAGRPILSVFFKKIGLQYPCIFEKYTRKGLARFIFGKYGFDVVCFSSGMLTETPYGRQTWVAGKDFYCADLWKTITK